MSSSTPDPNAATAGDRAPVSGSRRALLKAGFATAPLAVITRPAQATEYLCRAPSAWGSLHKSGPGKQYQTCSGRTPGYWKQQQHFNQWPIPYVPVTQPPLGYPASSFHGVGFSGNPNMFFGTMTLLDVLGEGGNAGHHVALGRHIVAALLNAASGKTPVLTVSMVLNIWNEYVTRGYFEPTAGVQWDAGQIVKYLETTMPV